MATLEDITIDDFSGRVGQAFQATAAERGLTLTLASVDPLPRAEEHEGREPFSLEFTDPDPHHVPQQTLAVQHEELGSFDLFVVPLGPSEQGMRYEAIFS
jgi:hypothetical protein